MNKPILLSLIGLTVIGSGIGIVALQGGFEGDSFLLPNSDTALVSGRWDPTKVLSKSPGELLDNSEEIANKYLQIPCSKYFFKGYRWKNPKEKKEDKGLRVSLSRDSKNPKLLELSNKNISGCLSVWWEKSTYNDKKWKGKWNLLWAVNDGKYGVLIFSTAETENGELKLDGSAYTLKKKGTTWETIGSQHKEPQKITEQNKDKLIIKPGQAVDGKNGKLWGFEFETENICKTEDDCDSKTGTKTSSKKTWNLVKGKGSSVKKDEGFSKGWSSNFGAWSKELFSSNHQDIYKNIEAHFELIYPKTKTH